MKSPLVKSILLFFIILGVVVTSFAFAIMHHDDGDNRVKFSLVNQDGERITQKNLSGHYKIVFFGFTSCTMICPTQMSKLTQVMYKLESSGHAKRIIPTFISVDPERDTPEKVKAYIDLFHVKFIGLTGSRVALQSTADSFKTLLAAVPDNPQKNYQITHSSVAYVVDPFNRIVDFISFEEDIPTMAKRIRKLI